MQRMVKTYATYATHPAFQRNRLSDLRRIRLNAICGTIPLNTQLKSITLDIVPTASPSWYVLQPSCVPILVCAATILRLHPASPSWYVLQPSCVPILDPPYQKSYCVKCMCQQTTYLFGKPIK
ncbi:unnamed protein product [Ranitomeya imitator]|uniref:Uncharacterized protein n=1 Tax=Ranitomeya imitator TaxID=111125 RepID=A0ABN9KSZ4_9NEOB|nr:unnamed protein product [Ranitomeya imitator]